MDIKTIKISKGMSREDVNSRIYNYLYLVSDIYDGNNSPHVWKCKCGNLIENRRWSDIKNRNDIYCNQCVSKNKYKGKIESTKEYKYVKAYKKGDILPSGEKSSHTHIEVKHEYCGNTYIVQSGQFINAGKRCGKCCQVYENSFAHYIEVELGLKLEDVWDFEKNTVNPYHIWKSGSEKVWVKCQGEDINELNGLTKKNYHESSLVHCNNFTKGNECPYCVSISGYIHPYDSFGYHNFDKVMSWHPDNEISPFRVARNSNKKYKFICETCNHEWESVLGNTSKGKWCPKCNKSKGEKKVESWLSYRNINYIYDEPYFSDLLSDKGNPLRPDFILPDHKIWIEYDGEFHYKDMTGTLRINQIHDKIKNNYAKKHGWKMIRIPYWDFDNIENILEKIIYVIQE